MALRIRPRSIFLLVAVVLLVLLGAGWRWVQGIKSSGLPLREGNFSLTGLNHPVQVRWDRWGVPHIEAQDLRDAAAAIGWLHANDRLSQMEMGRRLASGRLAEFAGKIAVEMDKEARRMRLRAAAQATWDKMPSESRANLEAYAQGVNSWIRHREDDLPPFFQLTGIEPEPWTPVDSLCFSVLMAQGLSFAFGRPEELRFQWLQTFGEATTLAWIGEEGVHVPPETLRLAEEMPDETRIQAAQGSKQNMQAIPAGGANGGSNNWAIGPSRSKEGGALLANDPHLDVALPNRWFQVQVRAADYEVMGMSLPGLPGIVIGQNKDLAWAFTSAMMDDHDLFLEEVNADQNQVRRGDSWQPIQREEQFIEVSDGDPIAVTVQYTEIGPFFEASPDRGLPPRSLAWTLFHDMDPMAAFSALGRSTTLEEARKAASLFVCPAQNLVVAHRDGGLMHAIIGNGPQRGDGDGYLPVPAWDAAYAWQGLRPHSELPLNMRPQSDMIVTANHNIRPEDYEEEYVCHFDTAFRAERIQELLEERMDWTLEAFGSVQTDVVSLFALELIAQLDGEYSDGAQQALEVLRAWDGEMSLYGPSALFALTERALQAAIFADEEEHHRLPRPHNMWQRWRLQRVMKDRVTQEFFDDITTEQKEDRNTTIGRALQAAWDEVQSRWGADRRQWNYGELHVWPIAHPLGNVPFLGKWFNRGLVPMPGSDTTVAAMGGPWIEGRQGITWGPSMRWLADPRDPDRSLAVLPAGQSGHPGDSHYFDQNDLYREGRYHPCYWSQSKIQENTVATMELTP